MVFAVLAKVEVVREDIVVVRTVAEVVAIIGLEAVVVAVSTITVIIESVVVAFRDGCNLRIYYSFMKLCCSGCC